MSTVQLNTFNIMNFRFYINVKISNDGPYASDGTFNIQTALEVKNVTFELSDTHEL